MLGDHPLSQKSLMFDSEQVLWRKGEKEFAKIEKILKFNANKQLKLDFLVLKVPTFLLYNESMSLV